MHIKCMLICMFTCIFIIVDNIEIDFTKYENVVLAFTELMTILQDNVPEDRLKIIKNRCIAVTDGEFRDCIKTQVDDIDSFFTLLSRYTLYCNWINILLVEIIAIASGCKELKNLVGCYRKAIYSRKLKQVWKYIPQESKRSEYYKEVKVRFNSKSPNDVTVEELFLYSNKLANKIALLLMNVTSNCLSITWLVPTDKVYQLLLSVLTLSQETREEDLLQIGTWEIYHPQFVLQKLRMEFG